MDAFEKMKNMRVPSTGPARGLAKLLLFGGAAGYAINGALFNVEGGHRAIVFNRLVGIKETVRSSGSLAFVSRRVRTMPSTST